MSPSRDGRQQQPGSGAATPASASGSGAAQAAMAAAAATAAFLPVASPRGSDMRAHQVMPLSPSNRSSRILGMSSALSEVGAVDAMPVSGDDEDYEAEAQVQAELDRRRGMWDSRDVSFSSGVGGPVGTPERNGGDEGAANGEGGGVGRGFGRTESVVSVAESVSSLGSPVASGPGGAYNLSTERTSMHHLTHLS